MMRDDDRPPPNFEGFGARPAPDPALPADLITDRSLLRSAKGDVRACEFNARILMAASAQFNDLHFDEFLCRVRLGDRDWSDGDDRDALIWLQGTHRVPSFTLGQVRNAILALAYERRRDSLREFVAGLPEWDGAPRIPYAFRDAWGAPDDEMTRMASTNLFVAMIARAERPGAQVDTLWTFEGPQGSQKSRALRALGGQFHAEVTAPIGTPDFLRELRGLWLAELSELDALRGREASTIKRLLSSPRDRYVEKFEKHAVAYPRRAIAVATTNEAQYWQDATGARRLIPIRADRIDVELIERDRLQWLAEARHYFAQGATWWEYPETMADAQEDRQQVDPWEDALRRIMAEGRRIPDAGGQTVEPWPEGWISTAEILSTWLRLEPHQQGPAAGPRIGKIMRRLGYQPKRADGRPQQRGWVRDVDT